MILGANTLLTMVLFTISVFLCSACGCGSKINVDSDEIDSTTAQDSDTLTENTPRSSDTTDTSFDSVVDTSEGTDTNQPIPVDALTGNETAPDNTWIRIEAGSFTFGSPEEYPCRGPGVEKEVPVTLTRPFFILATELTQDQWKSLDLSNPSKNDGNNKPVTFINFYEAAVWCNKLSMLENLETCYDLETCGNSVGSGCGPEEPWGDEGCWDTEKNFNCTGEIHRYSDWYECPGYRLPTTAEWEYAAKAGVTETRTYGGDLNGEALGSCSIQSALEDIAWYCNNANGEAHPVKGKLPNPWGLYDTLGNVYEWVDFFSDGQALDADNPDQQLTDPIGPRTGTMKDMRGGSMVYSGCLINPTWQTAGDPVGRFFYTGFRPVRTIFE